jgi:hypothetical protein
MAEEVPFLDVAARRAGVRSGYVTTARPALRSPLLAAALSDFLRRWWSYCASTR